MDIFTIRLPRLLIIAFYFGLLLLGFSACLERTAPKEVQLTIDLVKQRFAPDGRVALFEVKSDFRNDTLVLIGETNLAEAHEVLLQELDALDLVYGDEILLLPDASLNAQIRGVINVSVANIRSKPSHSAELATQATLGIGLKVYKQKGDWYYVQTPDAYLGWLDNGAFTLMDEKDYQTWSAEEKIVFTADYGFALKTPMPDAERLGDLVAGNILLSGGSSGAYRMVSYPDGREGFVLESEVEDFANWLAGKEEFSAAVFIKTARKYIGRPYLWGGTSGKGMDCSGFTKNVFFMNGIVLPRDASQQVHAGIEVATDSTFNNLQAGDFVFFGQKAKGEQREKIRHVGIFLGNGQFIHSGADNPGIKIESLLPDFPNYAPHRRQTFVRARRMNVGSPGVTPIRNLPDFFGLTNHLKN